MQNLNKWTVFLFVASYLIPYMFIVAVDIFGVNAYTPGFIISFIAGQIVSGVGMYFALGDIYSK